MSWRISIRLFVLASIILFAIGLLVIKNAQSYSDQDRDDESVKSKDRTLVRDGITYVVLDSLTISRNGIELTKLSPISARGAQLFYGTVIMPETILNDASNFSSARGVYETAKSRMVMSEKELHRLEILNETKNVSDKVLEQQKSQYIMDKNSEVTALKNFELVKSQIVLKWGDRISNWIFSNDNALSKLVKGELEVIEAAAPVSDMSIHDYQTATITTSSGRTVAAKFLGYSGVADPMFQMRSIFFLIAGRNQDLIPGVNVIAHVLADQIYSGVFIPKSALVWYKSKPWVYYEKRRGEFCRIPISTEIPQPGGYLLAGILKSGDVIVSKGAQLLLSEELKSQIRAED